MKCASFDYVRPASVAEAVRALDATEDAKILAGGQSLVPVLALRMARPAVLVDINRIPAIAGIRRTDDAVEIGALTRHQVIAAQTEHPLLAEAARWIGHAAIRTRGTLGGSIAHADPSAELPVIATATGATIAVTGPGGRRTVGVDEFFLSALVTSLGENEMVTSVRFPRPRRWGFAEFARRHGDFALVTAVVVEIDDEVRVALGGVDTRPVRVAAAETVLADGGRAAQAADAVADAIEPTGDLHGSTAFRRAVAVEMTRRALTQTGID